MMAEQASLVDAATNARHRGAVDPLDAWFADDLNDVEQALAFADHVLSVMESRHFADYRVGSTYLQVVEEHFTADVPQPVGQSRLTDYEGDD